MLKQTDMINTHSSCEKSYIPSYISKDDLCLEDTIMLLETQ